MATATVTPTDSASVVDIKTYNETYRVYVKAKEDGKIDPESVKFTTSGKENAAWEKLEKGGWQNVLEQTVKLYEAGTVAGISQLVEDPEEAVNVFNRGVAQKTGQKLKALLTEIKDDGTSLVFDPTVDAFDTLEMLGEATKRRNLSPVDKARTAIRNAIKAMFPSLEGDALEAKLNAMLSSM
jgi:hypothetical protein